MKLEEIKKALEPLIGSKLTKIRSEEYGFVLEFSNGRTFTGHLKLNLNENKLEADLRVICGYHGRKRNEN